MGRESVTVLMATVEGTAPNGDLVGGPITARLGTPTEVLDQIVEMGLRKLKAEHPGVKDLRVLQQWKEVELPAPEEEDE